MTPTELRLLATLTAAAQLHSSTALPSFLLHKCKCRAHSPLSDCLQQVITVQATLLRTSSPHLASHLFKLGSHASRLSRAVAAAADQLRRAQFNLPAAVAENASRAAFRCGSCVPQLPLLTFVLPGGLSCNCFVLLAHYKWASLN